MKTKKVLLDTIPSVKAFVAAASEYNFDIDLQSKRHTVDGKSIMGVFSLDLSGPLTVVAHAEDPTAFFNQIASFIITED